MIHFHRVLIATAILFCAGFSLRSLMVYGATGDSLSLALFVAFLIATGALGYYLLNLRKFLRL
ncbi:MAG TPA: hypothetical protein VGA78_10925 [Gemmatimonadales bacterium]|jgi:hypothetical protein